MRLTTSPLSHYQAVCACGWKNWTLKASPKLAQEDADAHLKARRRVA